MYSVSITTFNRERKGRVNYFTECWNNLVEAGILDNPLIYSIDIFVGHEKDQWCIDTLPDDYRVNIHYLEKELDHRFNILAVMKHAVSDMTAEYHLYLEDDIAVKEPYMLTVFNEIWSFQMSVKHPEKISVFLDFRPTHACECSNGYREEGLNTFTAVMFFKLTIQRFLDMFPNNYPIGKAPDWIFGHAVQQPTFTMVPGLFKHIGLESVAHKRCFNTVIGDKHDL